jgi:hypothetical protein
MTLTCNDGETCWKIQLPEGTMNHGDKVIVPDRNGDPAVLVDFLLVEFARERLLGLRLLSETSINPVLRLAGGEHDMSQSPGQDAPR